MILHNKIDKIDKINGNRIEKLVFLDYGSLYIGNPYSNVINSIVLNDTLQLDVKYGRMISFANKTTDDCQYTRYNTSSDGSACLIFNKDLTQKNITWYNTKYLSPPKKIDNFAIRKDDSNNTYHIGYTEGQISNNASFTIENLGLNRSETQYYGHLIKYDFDSNVTLKLSTLLTGSTTGKVLINDYSNINNYNYLLLTSDKYSTDQYISYRKDNYASTPILNDSKKLNNTCSIVKFDQNFNNVLWYKKLYGALSTGNEYVQKLDINNTLTFNCFHMVEDSENNMLYSTINGPTGQCELFATNGTNDELLLNLTGSYGNFIISKIDSNGNFKWTKAIYYNSNTINFTNYIRKIIYDNGNIYLLLKTYKNITINNVSYGSLNKYNVFVIKMDSNGNFIWVKNVTNKDDVTTDMVIYNDEYIFISCNYYKTTKVSGYNLVSNGTGSYIIKINCDNGDVLNITNKTINVINGVYYPSINIKTLNVIDDYIYIGGDFIGGAYIGGKTINNYKETKNPEVFLEKIKINKL